MGRCDVPTEEELDVMFRAKAKKEEWMQGETMYGGRPRDMLMTVVKTLEIYEKLMERLVLAGFKPEDLQFLIPMNKMKGTSEEKNEMRAKMSSFLCRLLKSAFPNSTQYTYFRAGDHGFEDCLGNPCICGLPVLQGTRTTIGVAGNCNPMQCEPSASFHWKDCTRNQACRTRSCKRACTMARPHCTKRRPKDRAECLQSNRKHRGRKASCR